MRDSEYVYLDASAVIILRAKNTGGQIFTAKNYPRTKISAKICPRIKNFRKKHPRVGQFFQARKKFYPRTIFF